MLSRILLESGDLLLQEIGDAILVEQQKTEYVTEDWEAGIDPTKWFNWGGAEVTVENGRLKIVSTTVQSFHGIEFFENYDLRDSYVFNQVVEIGSKTIRSVEVYPVYVISHNNPNNQVFWYIDTQDNLRAYKRVNGSTEIIAIGTYNPLVHKYFRIREANGVIYYEYSTYGEVWVKFAVIPAPFDVDVVVAGMQVGTWQDEGQTTYALFDNFNLVGAYIVPTTGYFLNGVLIATPNTFKRDFIFIKTDVLTLSGKIGRDISKVKEKFMLGFEMLTTMEAETMLAIIELNLPVRFYVNDGNMQIDKVMFPYIGSQSYQYLGDNSLVNLELELIEEDV